MNEGYADPAGLGLCSFSLTSVLLGLSGFKIYTDDSMVLGTAFFYTGFAQLFAGIFSYYRGHMFPTAAFTSFSCFFFSLTSLQITPYWGWSSAPNHHFMGWYLCMWAIFAWGLVLGSMGGKQPYLNTVMLFFIAMSLSLSAISFWADSDGVSKAGGIMNFIIGVVGFYFGGAVLINGEFEALILPVGITPYLERHIASQLAARKLANHEPIETPAADEENKAVSTA